MDEILVINDLLERLAIARLLVLFKTEQEIRTYDLHVHTVGLRKQDGEPVGDNDTEPGFLSAVFEAQIWGTNLKGEPSEHLDVALATLADRVTLILNKADGIV